MRVEHKHFKQCMRCFTTIKNGHPLCRLKHHILFYGMCQQQRRWFVIDRSFFFPSYPKKYRLVLFVVDILSSFLIILISNFFFLNPFDKVLFISIEYFNFNFWYITFFNLILVFLFLISFLGLFVKVLRVFNFIHQFKFMGCYFFFF